jgi:hypothetical protein
LKELFQGSDEIVQKSFKGCTANKGNEWGKGLRRSLTKKLLPAGIMRARCLTHAPTRPLSFVPSAGNGERLRPIQFAAMRVIAGLRGELQAVVVIYIFEEIHDFRRRPRIRGRIALSLRPTWSQAAAGAEDVPTEPTSAVCKPIVLREQEVKMASLFVIHQGFGDDQQLWGSTLDGTFRANDAVFDGVRM